MVAKDSFNGYPITGPISIQKSANNCPVSLMSSSLLSQGLLQFSCIGRRAQGGVQPTVENQMVEGVQWH